MTNISLQAFYSKAFIFKLFHRINKSYIRYVPVKGTGYKSLNRTIKGALWMCAWIYESISGSIERKALCGRFETVEYSDKSGIITRGYISKEAAKNNRMFLSDTESNIAIAL